MSDRFVLDQIPDSSGMPEKINIIDRLRGKVQSFIATSEGRVIRDGEKGDADPFSRLEAWLSEPDTFYPPTIGDLKEIRDEIRRSRDGTRS